MPPKSSNDNSAYKNQIKLNLDKLKNGNVQKVKVDLTKNIIKSLASQVGVLSEDVKLYMKLSASGRYYALNDRTINLLMKGNIDMSAVVGEEGQKVSESDAEVVAIIGQETQLEVVVVDKNKTRAGGAFYPYINNTIFDLSKYVILNMLIERIINIIAYILLYKLVDYQILNYNN